jgi:dolichol-phosphate hexosyltransferase
MSESTLLTIIVPVFNERATLRAAIKRLNETELPVPIEIIVVDDGSTDGSLETVSDLELTDAIRVVRHRRNRGKGAAIRTGIAEAQGDFLTIFDADMEYDPADYRQLLEPLLAGQARVAYGTRTFGAHTVYSFWHVIGNKVVTMWANLLFNTWLTDLETCFKVARTDVWREADLRSNDFGVEAEITAKLLRRKERVYEAPITYYARSREAGKKLTWRDGFKAIWILTRVRVLGR